MADAKEITLEDVAECLEIVRKAAPYLRRTPNPDHLLVIDSLRDKIAPVFEQLNGLAKAEFAVGIWRYCLERGMYNECLKMLIASKVFVNKYPFSLKMEAATAAGVLSQRLSNFATASRYLDQAWRIAQFLDTPCDKAFIQHQMGMLERRRGNLAAAVKLHETSIEMAKQANDSWIIAAGYNALGAIAVADLRLDDAEQWLTQSAEIFASMGETRRGLEVLINRACVASERKKYDLAEDTFRKCLSVCRLLNDPSMYAVCLHNYGDMCTYTNKLEEARTNLACAYEQAHLIGYTQLLPFTIRAMGQVFFVEGNFKKAICLFSFSEHLRAQTGVQVTALEQHETTDALNAMRLTLRANTFVRYCNNGKKLDIDKVLAYFNA